LQSADGLSFGDILGTPLKTPSTGYKRRKRLMKRPLPTPLWSTEKRMKWFQYDKMPKDGTVVKPVRRSERLRAVVKRPQKWYDY